ncbi:response regulator transcription factor [Roseateles sp.]|jgi:two-component system phosphate regulon response regulator PhoB|uniref:response regulator transcription factor n=1 Tax=Roseateles sp. TaxID=1971397 RepID=UPI0037CA73C3
MKKILLVDDHADIRKLVRMTLEFEDYDVHEASDAPEAVRAAGDWQPDLVLLDVMMPGEYDGLEACRRLKRGGNNSTPPRVMLLSARGRALDREAGLGAGADAYLVKPFSPLQLIDSIAALWSRE